MNTKNITSGYMALN